MGSLSSSTPAKKPKPKQHGWLHNLVTNVADDAGGLGQGIKGIAHALVHPHDFVDMGHAVAHDYNKNSAIVSLLRGHFHQAYDQAKARPFDTLMDTLTAGEIAAAPFTFGASLSLLPETAGARAAVGAGRAASMAHRLAGVDHVAAAGSKADEVALFGKAIGSRKKFKIETNAGTLTKDLSRSPMVRARQVATQKLLAKAIPNDMAHVGVEARAARQARRAEQGQLDRTIKHTLEAHTNLIGKMTAAGKDHLLPYVHVVTSAASDGVDHHAALKSFAAKNAEDLLAARHSGNAGVDSIEHQLVDDGRIGMHHDPRDPKFGDASPIKSSTNPAVEVVQGAPKRIATPDEITHLERKQHLYEDHATLDEALHDSDFQQLVGTTRDMARLGHATAAAAEHTPITDEKLLGLLNIEREAHGLHPLDHIPAHYAPRSHVAITTQGKEFETRLRSTRGRKPDSYRGNTGTNVARGVDESDPRIYAHTFAQLMSDNKTVRQTLAAMRQAKVVDKTHPDLLKGKLVPIDSHANHLKGLAAIAGDIPKERWTDMVTKIHELAGKAHGLEEGQTLAVPRHLYGHIARDQRNADKVLKYINKGNDFWRAATLPLRPAWTMNNLLSNMLLLATGYGHRAIPAMLHGATKAGKELIPHDLIESSLYADNRFASKGRLGKLVTGPANVMNKLNAKIAEDPFRRAAFLAEIKPLAMREMRSGEHWTDAAKRLLEDPEVMDKMVERTVGNMVDFRSLSDFERNWLRTAMPFYGWLKGSTKRSVKLVADQPGRAAALTQIGKEGERELAAYQDQPDFVRRSMVPLGRSADGTRRMFSLYGANPFSTTGDLLGSLESLLTGPPRFGGENPASNLGPMMKVPIEAFMNKDLFYGKPIDQTGTASFAKLLGKQGIASFPQYRTLGKLDATLRGHRKTPDALDKFLGVDPSRDLHNSLYVPNTMDTLLQYIGYPVRNLNEQTGRAMSAREKQQQILSGY